MITLFLGYGLLASCAYVGTMLIKDVPAKDIKTSRVATVAVVGGLAGVVACKGAEFVAEQFATQQAMDSSVSNITQDYSIHENMSDTKIEAYINNWEANYNPNKCETVFYDFTDGGYTFSEADAMAYENA